MSGKLKEGQNKFPIKKLMPVIGVVLLLLAGLFAYKNFSAKPVIADKDKTIAILPFKNISINKEENEPFCVGVALELQKKLELMGGLLPIASQSVEKFRDTKLAIGDIAAELGGIRYILQGTVQRDKNKIKVFVSLIDVISNKEWSDNFPGK
jgi:TolB-like protein